MILVGSRLQEADLPETQIHPIVLSGSHKITRLIFKDMHEKRLHNGPTALLAAMRLRFWPLRGRALARSVVLPRVQNISRPFAATGVDFAGPLIIRSGARGVKGKKVLDIGVRLFHNESCAFRGCGRLYK